MLKSGCYHHPLKLHAKRFIMAINYSHSDFKKFGPNVLVTTANRIGLVKNPVKTDSYATFVAKVIADAAFVGGTDVAYADVGNDLQVTLAAKPNIDPSGTALITDDICVAVYDTVSQKVFLVQDANDRVITNETSDLLNIPALVFFNRELTAV